MRAPGFATPVGWIAAIAGYYAADLLTGGNIVLTTWLTAANLAGVATAFVLFMRIDVADRRLRKPRSILYLFAILCAGAAAAAVVGAGAAPIFFDSDIPSGLAFWFTTELVNGIVIVPVMLTAPWPGTRPRRLRRDHDIPRAFLSGVPVLACILSVLLGLAVGGPGAIAFPSPALLWCALTLSLFATALVTMLVSAWHLLAFTLGLLGPYLTDIDTQTMSDRLGITLLALGPLTVASIHTAKLEVLRRMELLATTDTLTGAASRSAFIDRGEKAIAGGADVAVLMLDIDGFKRINDAHGHATGDRALRAFAAAVREGIREGDLFGRLGGEEFAVVLSGTDAVNAMDIAERLRIAVEGIRLPLADRELRFTVSIGVAGGGPGRPTLDGLLAAADRALYRAKESGRNRVVWHDPGMPRP